jgi:RNA polymerase sigma-54 factor
MRFETSQHMKMGQTMRMAPRMIQSMEILQMPLAELEERIEQELESNPTLELTDGSGETALETNGLPDAAGDTDYEGTLRLDAPDSGDDFARLDSYQESNPDAAENEFDSGDGTTRDDADDRSERYDRDLRFERDGGTEYVERASSSGDTDPKMEAMAAAPARAESLIEQLRGQWALVDVDPLLRAPGELIISFIEDDGYLRTPLETIADRAPVSRSTEADAFNLPGFVERPSMPLLERALAAVQLFLEPAGVAARTPSECMILQLDAMEEHAADLGWPAETFEHAKILVKDHIEDLMQNRLPRVAERTHYTLDQIKSALTLLKRLSLAPARRLVEETTRPIVPDAIVEYDADQDRYYAYLNDRRMPNVRINQEYAKLARDRTMIRKDRDFIKTNLGNAQWLIDAVGQRRQTLLRVISAVIIAQREFFDYGPQALRPLPMQTIADQLGIHVATVSRAVAEKYIATPRGVLPLRKFFSGGVQTKNSPATGEGGGEDLAWEAIKVALREVIDAEDKKSPLSDEALALALKERGIDIARRTVAKYREQLGIPAKRLRKTF